MGYLFSTGYYHNKDNELIRDDWYEFEWKVKGDRKYSSYDLSWSYRIDLEPHEHP